MVVDMPVLMFPMSQPPITAAAVCLRWHSHAGRVCLGVRVVLLFSLLFLCIEYCAIVWNILLLFRILSYCVEYCFILLCYCAEYNSIALNIVLLLCIF